MEQFNTADKIAAYLGGGLVVFGVVVIGLLEMLFGSGHPVDGEGQIVHEALVPLEIRSYIILLGLVVWGVYAIYKVVATTPAEPSAA
jgi:ABC-type Na+ efflux pump permease subunit